MKKTNKLDVVAYKVLIKGNVAMKKQLKKKLPKANQRTHKLREKWGSDFRRVHLEPDEKGIRQTRWDWASKRAENVSGEMRRLKREARYLNLALGYVKGRKYKDIENNCRFDNKPAAINLRNAIEKIAPGTNADIDDLNEWYGYYVGETAQEVREHMSLLSKLKKKLVS